MGNQNLTINFIILNVNKSKTIEEGDLLIEMRARRIRLNAAQ